MTERARKEYMDYCMIVNSAKEAICVSSALNTPSALPNLFRRRCICFTEETAQLSHISKESAIYSLKASLQSMIHNGFRNMPFFNTPGFIQIGNGSCNSAKPVI